MPYERRASEIRITMRNLHTMSAYDACKALDGLRFCGLVSVNAIANTVMQEYRKRISPENKPFGMPVHYNNFCECQTLGSVAAMLNQSMSYNSSIIAVIKHVEETINTIVAEIAVPDAVFTEIDELEMEQQRKATCSLISSIAHSMQRGVPPEKIMEIVQSTLGYVPK